MPVTAISEINAIIDKVIGPLCERGQPYGLLDFPAHGNIGDSAIYLGELRFFDRMFGRPANYVCHFSDPVAAVGRHLPEGTIFLHGGGNFGDVWGHHQPFREAVIAAYPDRKIVQLPQSIHFADPARIAQTARIIAAHRDFTLLVRDQPSYELATRHFDCKIHLCPDMAFTIRKLDAGRPPQHETLCLMRTDREQQPGLQEDFAKIGLLQDWVPALRLRSLRDRIENRVVGALPASRGLFMPGRERAFRSHAQARVDAGARQLGSAELVVTDRLHGHILSVLLHKPHIVLDNSYGKVSRFIDAWPKDSVTHRARNFAEAAEVHGRLRAAAGQKNADRSAQAARG